MRVLLCVLAALGPLCSALDAVVELPKPCEVCKLVATELEAALAESARSSAVIETTAGVVGKYVDSELRLIETLEGLCDRLAAFSLHKERRGAARFAAGPSQTMETLRGLVDKGVKVDLGIPEELWDAPSVEISELKARCEWGLAEWEDHIEEWFHRHRTHPLTTYLCEERVLPKKDQGCLFEDAGGSIASKSRKGDEL